AVVVPLHEDARVLGIEKRHAPDDTLAAKRQKVTGSLSLVPRGKVADGPHAAALGGGSHCWFPLISCSLMCAGTGVRSHASSPTWPSRANVSWCTPWSARCVCPCSSASPRLGSRHCL